jgi:hypothetical protein
MWPSIRDRGLLSVTAMLDAFCVHSDDRAVFESAQRTRTMDIFPGGEHVIALPDQRDMPADRLTKALTDGTTPEQWYRLISGKVFFWPEESRLSRWLGNRAHRRVAHDVVIIDTQRLVDLHLERLWLCHMNSSNTLPTPHARGVDIFQRVSTYPALQPVVEVAVDYSVPDLVDCVIALRRIEGKAVLAAVTRASGEPFALPPLP